MLSAAVVGLACGAMDEEALGDGSGGDGGLGGDAGAATPGVGSENDRAVASGVVVVHAATFPSFRLCFENFPGRKPAPETSLKPNANVVGVEVGSAVRLDPIQAPGKIHVIDVRELAGKESESCGDLICTGPTCLGSADYATLDAIDDPLGSGGVELLALHGCGNNFVLTDLGASSGDCGAGYDGLKGNLGLTRVPLIPQTRGGSSPLPVQLVHLAPLLEAQSNGSPLEVTFGELATAGRLPQTVAEGLPLFQQGAPAQVTFDDTDQAVYGTNGFRIAQRGDGGADFELDQSLAEVQDLSSPDDVPASYYAAASNYVLLLIGDPRITKTADAGAPFDARRALHLLAVPVIDPIAQDAGADASPEPRN